MLGEIYGANNLIFQQRYCKGTKKEMKGKLEDKENENTIWILVQINYNKKN